MTLRAGRYELLDTIASGGMATVYLGRAVGAGGFERLVAIKTMHPHLSSEPEFVAMFLDEARLAARIRHPNVVGTIDIQQDELGLLLVMDFIEGPSMSQVLRALGKQKTTLPLDITVRIMLDVLAGLHAAHELCGAAGEPLNVVHRDVSPQNILVGVDGIARIMDFGVARAESRISTTKGGDAKGKVSYMAPEQASQKEMDRRADVYAAGLVFWELLIGRRLLRGDNDMVIMHQIFHANHPSPHECIESIPRELSDVVMRAISRERDDRYPTMAAFAEAVDRAVQTSGIVVASAKVVGAFVRELSIHKSPTDLASGSRPLPMPASIRTLPSADPAITSPGVTAAPVSDGVTTGTESRGGFAATPSNTPRPAAARNRILMGVCGAVVVGVGVWFALGAMSSGDKPDSKVVPASSDTPVIADKPPELAPITTAAPVVSTSNAPLPAAASASASVTTTARIPTANTGTSKSPKTFIPKEL
jgi:eukaryotic-like serine/threonine-protein kinase